MQNREMVAMRLDLIAAKAKQMSEDVKHGRLWEGDLSRGLADIQEQLEAAAREVKTRS
jgi:hypothetical protein